MVSTKRLAVFGMAITALAISAAKPALAEVSTQERVVINRIAFDECRGEDIWMTGEAHFVTTVTTDKTGGYHFSRTINWSGVRAVGLVTGTEYVATAGAHITKNKAVDSLPTTFTQQQTINFVVLGPGLNEQFKFLEHFTIDANGVTTSEIEMERVLHCDEG